MKEYFLRLYTYNHWANDRYLQLFEQHSPIPERVQLLMSHVLVAQKLWLTRIKGNPDLSLHIWKTLPIGELKTLAVENTKNWLAYLAAADQAEFDRMLSYQNFQKIHYTNRVSDIIIHTANHATYHRAQFAVLFRQIGIEPPNTDFITFAREFSGELNL
ncbi:MAG: DinB family protein [Cytophagales bacterium]|nr:DinB family protein [Bernardetiaceae bacterium]MDW8205468.1 DinB family protein [Cytophagales bacterium]